MPGGHGSKNTIGMGSQGKGSGSGANTIDATDLGENQVLSNRDKKQNSGARGQDSKAIESDQMQDHAGNRGGG
jgi:hypothetical protein